MTHEHPDHEPSAADAPQPPPKVTATGRSARNMQTLAGIIMLALILVAVIVIASGGKDDPVPAPNEPDAQTMPTGVAETQELLKGIPQNDAVLGDPKAPVTILEIVDLQCPYCAMHQVDVQPQVIQRLVRTGQARIQLVSIGMLGEDSETLRNVHERLAANGKGWEFATLTLLNQGRENSGYASDEYLQQIVAAIPGTTPADAGREVEPAVARRVRKTRALVNAHVAQLEDPNQFGTPAFAVGPTGADPATFKPVELRGDESVLTQLIAAVRQQSARRGTS